MCVCFVFVHVCVFLCVEIDFYIRCSSTFFHFSKRACRLGDFRLAHVLLDHKADVNAELPFSSTYLHQAIYGGSKDLIILLLMSGINREAVDGLDQTAMSLAVSCPFFLKKKED